MKITGHSAITTIQAVIIGAIILAAGGIGYFWYSSGSSSSTPEPTLEPNPSIELPTRTSASTKLIGLPITGG